MGNDNWRMMLMKTKKNEESVRMHKLRILDYFGLWSEEWRCVTKNTDEKVYLPEEPPFLTVYLNVPQKNGLVLGAPSS